MVWTVIFSTKSKDQLKKLDKTIEQGIVNSIENILEDPFSSLDRLKNSRFYKLRVGKYRVIIDLIGNKMIVFVIKVDKRSRVYQ